MYVALHCYGSCQLPLTTQQVISTALFLSPIMQESSWRVSHYQTSPIILSVNLRLLEYLSDSPYLKYLEHIVDETIKLPFKKVEEPQYVEFGLATDNDESHNICGGQLKLMGSALSVD